MRPMAERLDWSESLESRQNSLREVARSPPHSDEAKQKALECSDKRVLTALRNFMKGLEGDGAMLDAARASWVLCRDTDFRIASCADGAFLKSLLNIVIDTEPDSNCGTEEALKAIINLASDDRLEDVLIKKHNIAGTLLAALHSGVPSYQAAACTAIQNLTAAELKNGREAFIEQLMEGFVFGLIAGLLDDSDPENITRGLKAISGICHHVWDCPVALSLVQESAVSPLVDGGMMAGPAALTLHTKLSTMINRQLPPKVIQLVQFAHKKVDEVVCGERKATPAIVSISFIDTDGDKIMFKLEETSNKKKVLVQYVNERRELASVEVLEYKAPIRQLKDAKGKFTLRPQDDLSVVYRLQQLARQAECEWRGDEPIQIMG